MELVRQFCYFSVSVTAAEALFWGFRNGVISIKMLLDTGRLGKKKAKHRTFGENIYGAFDIYITQAGYPEGKLLNFAT